MFYFATGVTPAMCMRLTGVGSQYLVAAVDAAGDPLDGSKTYRLTLPKDIPAARFWSLTLYDNQKLPHARGRAGRVHRPLRLTHPARRRGAGQLGTPQLYPRAGSQSYPTPAAEPDGSTVLYVSPTRPPDVAPGNWVQTDPDKGWCTLLRLYSPLAPFLDKTWKPGEFEVVS